MKENVYMRATVYIPTQNKSYIFAANGLFDEVWQFTLFLLNKGCEVIASGDEDTFIDCNCGRDATPNGKLHKVSEQKGRPQQFEERHTDNRIYNALMVGRCGYIPYRFNSIDGGAL